MSETPRIKIFVPRDAAALAVGADKVAIALADRGRSTRSRSSATARAACFWLEPMVEVATPQGRIAYGPVKAKDVEGLLAAGLLEGGEHPLRLGKPEEIPYLAKQSRLTFERCGIDRSARHRRLPRARRLRRPAQRACDQRRGYHRGRDQVRPARARRRRLPDRHQMDHRP